MPRRWRRRDGRVEMEVEAYGRQRRSAFSTVLTGLTVGVFVVSGGLMISVVALEVVGWLTQ